MVSRCKLPEVIFCQEETCNSGSRLIGENRQRKCEVGVFGFVLRGVGVGASAAREALRREKTVTATGAVDLAGVAGISGEKGAVFILARLLGRFAEKSTRYRIAVEAHRSIGNQTVGNFLN
ncbi:hypothetical protein U1Q18_049092 [Sarracenia purpurea var. burkii]